MEEMEVFKINGADDDDHDECFVCEKTQFVIILLFDWKAMEASKVF